MPSFLVRPLLLLLLLGTLPAPCLRAQEGNEPVTMLYRNHLSGYQITAFAVNSDATILAIGGSDGTLEILNLTNPEQPQERVNGLRLASINTVEFSIQADRLVVGGKGEVYGGVINTTTWQPEHMIAGERHITAAHDIGGVLFYMLDASTRQVISLDMTQRPHVDYVASSATLLGHSIDRRKVAVVDQAQVLLLDAARMRMLSKAATSLPPTITAIALPGKAYTAMIGTSDGDLLILDLLDGRVVDTIAQAHKGGISVIEAAENGVYTGGADGIVRRWTSYEEHGAPTVVARHVAPIVGLGVAYDGSRIAYAGADGTVAVVELAPTGDLLPMPPPGGTPMMPPGGE